MANHSAAEVASIKAKIRARAKELGIELEEHDDADNDSVSSLERAFTPGRIELRSGAAGRTIFGYGAVFGQLSRRMQFGYEQVSPTFFDHSYAEGWPDVVCRADHDSRMLLGANHSGTLRLSVDHRGLAYECDLAPSRQDVLESTARGDYPGSSFAFLCISDEFEYRNGNPVRNLLSGKLIDTGPVTVPAYGTSAPGLRSLAKHMQAPIEDVERLAAEGELRRLFTRSDQPPRGEAMSYPGRTGMDWRTAHLILLLHKFPPQTEAEIRQRARMLAELRAMRGLRNQLRHKETRKEKRENEGKAESRRHGRLLRHRTHWDLLGAARRHRRPRPRIRLA
ncbi:HK97 family phage prohead protease [Mycobacterium sp.]|uniref:HK97 family phage prohead protease n=1 Tax=Mycobacterium sp. TaxID=1785 RepID=UPI002C9D0522|nr:HK97 family phage prohead protease [Mycobacterium sp.]HTY33140.1 HK97 family phage prohead protease [Mycobacterium sp.]